MVQGSGPSSTGGSGFPSPEGLGGRQSICDGQFFVGECSRCIVSGSPHGCLNKESGAWLNALPISSLGLRMDNNTVRVSVDLRLGTTLCRPHACLHCGAEVNHLGTHGLSCVRSEGRHHRHAALNDIVHRALTAAHIPSRLEPSGIFRSDGKRPDAITVVPWKSGRLLVWDAICPDTFAPSYLPSAASGVGAVAAAAEKRKKRKYSHLDQCHSFVPVAIETAGVFGPETMEFLRELGRRLQLVSAHHNCGRLKHKTSRSFNPGTA